MLNNNIIYIIYVAILICLTRSSLTPWQSSNVSITELQLTQKAFIAYYNGTVYIFGGYEIGNSESQKRILTFPSGLDVPWTKTETSSITFGFTDSQSSVQIGEQLWMLKDSSRALIVYDLVDKRIDQTIAVDSVQNTGRCVTSFMEYIFVIDGWNTLVYNTFNNSWTTGTRLTQERSAHSCNVVGETIYVIGGWITNQGWSTVVYLTLEFTTGTNCCRGPWQQMSDTLSTGKFGHSSIVFDQKIYVIGGLDGAYVEQTDIIDTISKTISSPSTNKLPDGKGRLSVILVENTIFVYGGWPTYDNIHFRYASILTEAPTTLIPTITTISPTSAPTNPSTAPITTPPTISTISPTLVPTLTPTITTITPTTSPSPSEPIIDENTNNYKTSTMLVSIVIVAASVIVF